ncbi:MAG: hypothetical protein VCB43_16055 [Myxococcota bacterium]
MKVDGHLGLTRLPLGVENPTDRVLVEVREERMNLTLGLQRADVIERI